MNELKVAFTKVHESITQLEKVIEDTSKIKTSGRFIDNGDNTVADIKTGLTWVKDHDEINDKFAKRMTWNEAIEACKNLEYAGHKDWRLPTREELLTIVDLTKHDPAADPIFKTNADAWYLTSTPCAWFSGLAWIVNFNDGYVSNSNKDSYYYVRPVRSSQ
jgi:Protein of unknown function (DUF1566)